MAGALTTKQIKDGGGNLITMRMWDESGAGTGPFSFVSYVSSDSSGAAPIGTQASPASGYLSSVVAGDIAHDAVDSGNPAKIGGYAKAAAPTDVTADGDRVNAWFLRNGAQAAVLTAAGALIGGDATNGLDVDVTRVASQGFSASVTFTPAASSHVANDCNGAAGQFSFSPAPVSGSCVMITDAELEIDGGTAEATAWRLYLYNVTPPSAIADDGAWDLGSGDRASFLGYVDLGTAADMGSTQWVETHGINKVVKLSGATVFGYLVNLTTLTPANVAHIVKLYGLPV